MASDTIRRICVNRADKSPTIVMETIVINNSIQFIYTPFKVIICIGNINRNLSVLFVCVTAGHLHHPSYDVSVAPALVFPS